MTTVAVCLPSKGRARQLETNVLVLLHQVYPPDVRLVVMLAVCHGDMASIAAGTRLVTQYNGTHTLAMTLRDRQASAVEGWNKAYYNATADWYVLGADDVNYYPGWLAEALAVADETGAQVIGLNDGHTDLEQYAPHYMVSRRFALTYLGDYLAPPPYSSWWFDREVCEKAQALNLYAPAPDAHAEHWHPDWRTAEMDETYRQAWPLHDVDKAVYLARKRAGFPLDYVEVV